MLSRHPRYMLWIGIHQHQESSCDRNCHDLCPRYCINSGVFFRSRPGNLRISTFHTHIANFFKIIKLVSQDPSSRVGTERSDIRTRFFFSYLKACLCVCCALLKPRCLFEMPFVFFFFQWISIFWQNACFGFGIFHMKLLQECAFSLKRGRELTQCQASWHHHISKEDCHAVVNCHFISNKEWWDTDEMLQHNMGILLYVVELHRQQSQPYSHCYRGRKKPTYMPLQLSWQVALSLTLCCILGLLAMGFTPLLD